MIALKDPSQNLALCVHLTREDDAEAVVHLVPRATSNDPPFGVAVCVRCYAQALDDIATHTECLP